MNKYYNILFFCLTFVFTACDVTRSIPKGQQLYVGIKKIDYSEVPTVRHKSVIDTSGVITAIGTAAESVGEMLKGKTFTATSKEDDWQGKTEKERREILKARAAITKKAVNNAREEVNAVLETPPNNSLLGSSYYRNPLPFGLWFYTGFHDAKGSLGKWVYKVFAKDPILLSYVAPHMRAKVACNTLANYGFFQGRVGYDILPQRNPRKAKLRYDVHMGPLWTYGPVSYIHFPMRQDSILRANKSEQSLHSGDAFSVVDLSAERKRISALFRENGYFYWRDEYTTFRADTTIAHNKVSLHTQPYAFQPPRAKHRWSMGHTYIKVMRNIDDVMENREEEKNKTFYFSGNSLPVRKSVWQRAITHTHGDLYRLSRQRSTLEKLGAMNIFRQLGVNYMPADSTDSCRIIDLYVNAVLDNPYTSELETNLTFKSNQQMGPGLSYGINKKNAFRGGEKISFKVYGSYEWQLTSGSKSGGSALNSYELGSELSLTFPRIFAPFLSHKKRLMPAETKFAMDIDWKKRSKFFTLIDAGLSATYSWQHKFTTHHDYSPLTLQFDKVVRKSHTFDSIMSANPALYISMRDQFIPSMSYTYTYASASSHRNPIWLQCSISEAGNILSALYTARGQSFSKDDKTFFGSPYAQFLKTTAELHRHQSLTHRLTLATRLYAGAIWSYGNSTRAPYAEQFYAGGANSIRGFTVRTIGPGSYEGDRNRYSYIDRTGDIRLEANAELRAQLVGNINGAVFVDAGNVWLMRRDPMRPKAHLTANTLRNIAVGTGVGIRYDLGMLVLRFDIGVALHAPYHTTRSGFYNIPRFRDALNFHFAIGYPF